jgi:hypothetical protein
MEPPEPTPLAELPKAKNDVVGGQRAVIDDAVARVVIVGWTVAIDVARHMCVHVRGVFALSVEASAGIGSDGDPTAT